VHQHADVGVVLVVLGVAQPVVGDAVAADEGLLPSMTTILRWSRSFSTPMV
jgi:hypothetical protein